MIRKIASMVLLLTAAACSPPDLPPMREDAVAGPYPTIAPLDQVLAVGADPQLDETDAAALQSRAAALQARAATLPAQPVDPETRNRLEASIGNSGG